MIDMKIVAIQPALQLGQVEANLQKLEQLILAAYQEHTPDVITFYLHRFLLLVISSFFMLSSLSVLKSVFPINFGSMW